VQLISFLFVIHLKFLLFVETSNVCNFILLVFYSEFVVFGVSLFCCWPLFREEEISETHDRGRCNARYLMSKISFIQNCLSIACRTIYSSHFAKTLFVRFSSRKCAFRHFLGLSKCGAVFESRIVVGLFTVYLTILI